MRPIECIGKPRFQDQFHATHQTLFILHWRDDASHRTLAQNKTPMPYLTEMVLIGGFAAAFGIFVMFAAARALPRRNPRLDVVALPPPLNDLLPCHTPDEVALTPALPLGKVPVWFYQPLDLVGAGLVFGVFFALAVTSTNTSDHAILSLAPTTLMVNIGFQFLIAGLISAWACRRVGWIAWLGLRWPAWPWVFLIAPASVGFMWVVFGGLQASGYLKWMESLGLETVQDTVKLLQQSEDPRVLALLGLAAVVAAPLCEEIVFRGYFYPVLKKYAGAWPAAISASFVFAAAHGNLTVLLPLFVFGGLLVFVYEKTGSLWAPIAVHCCFNSTTVITQFVIRYFHLTLETTT